MKQKYLICEKCKKILLVIRDAPEPVSCCGSVMKELVPDVIDAATEKHVPVVTVDGRTVSVSVGEVEHPSVDEHFIEWIALETKEGGQIKTLQPGRPPKAQFALSESDEYQAAYEYCSLHGLWKQTRD